MKPQETKEEFIRLRAEGRSFQAIADMLKISKQTAINWSKELTLEIHNLRTLELDALYEKHFMGVKQRIEIFSEQLTKIRDELNKRGLESLTTDKLFEILIKLVISMKHEQAMLSLKQKCEYGMSETWMVSN